MATSDSLEVPRELSRRILAGPYARNSLLHHQIAFLLLPRWHRTPGLSEAYIESVAAAAPPGYRDAMYAQQVMMMVPSFGYAEPITKNLEVDLERLFAGTKEYYQHRSNSDLIDVVLILLAKERKREWVRELLKLRAEKRMLPSEHAAASPQAFRQIEQIIGK